jgi:hypothetical protein
MGHQRVIFHIFGSIGPKNMTIAQTANWMYVNGYELRHLLTLSIPVATIELVIRSYDYLSKLQLEPSGLKAQNWLTIKRRPIVLRLYGNHNLRSSRRTRSPS